MKAVVAAFNQEKALLGAFSVLTNLRMELFQALEATAHHLGTGGGWWLLVAAGRGIGMEMGSEECELL